MGTTSVGRAGALAFARGILSLAVAGAALAGLLAGPAPAQARAAGPATKVVVDLEPSRVDPGGASTTATAHVTDAQGDAVAGDRVVFVATGAAAQIESFVGVDHGDGTYSTSIASGPAVGMTRIYAVDTSVTPFVSGKAFLRQNPHPPGISVSVSPQIILAGTTAEVTVRLVASGGEAIPDEPIELEADEGTGIEFGDVEQRDDGSYHADLRAPFRPHERQVRITASYREDGEEYASHQDVTVGAGWRSTVADEHEIPVPAGVKNAFVVATGAPGGNGAGPEGGAGGPGATLSGYVPMPQGQPGTDRVIFAEVGGSGANGGAPGGPAGGVNGGGNGGSGSPQGGGGGGASDVRTCASDVCSDGSADSEASRLLVAGGGGGGGGSGVQSWPAGRGGDGTGTDGGDGSGGGTGGRGGGSATGSGLSGAAAHSNGGGAGGGGGGWRGGNGGKTVQYGVPIAGGGGGGGTSRVVSGLQVAKAERTASPASVAIAFVPNGSFAAASVDSIELEPPSIPGDGQAKTIVTARLVSADGSGASIADVEFTSSDPGQQIGPVSNFGGGYYAAEITSSDTGAGVSTITVHDNFSPELTATIDLVQTTPLPRCPCNLAAGTFKLPPRATRARVTAVGAQGGTGQRAAGNYRPVAPGGRGAKIVADLPLGPSAWQELRAVVGVRGEHGGAGGSNSLGSGGSGGSGGNTEPWGGGGGGATYIFGKAPSASEALLAVAGGGGGSSALAVWSNGAGGDAGQDGGANFGAQGGVAGAQPGYSGGNGSPGAGGVLGSGGGGGQGYRGGSGGGTDGGGGGGTSFLVNGTTPVLGPTPSSEPPGATLDYSEVAAVDVEVEPTPIPADGNSKAAVTATVTTADGIPIPGEEVRFTTSDPGQGIGAVTDNRDGTYSATIRASETLGSATITATARQSLDPITATTTLAQAAPEADLSGMTLALSKSSITADGTSALTATAEFKNRQGVGVPGRAVVFAASDRDVEFSATTDLGDGRYQAQITSSTKAGSVQVRAQDVSTAANPSASGAFTQLPGPAEQIAVALTDERLPADGKARTTVEARVTDANDNPVEGQALSFVSSDPAHTFTPVVDHGAGVYTSELTSSLAAGTATISVTDTSVTPHVSGAATLTQEVVPAAAVEVELRPATVTADGRTPVTVRAAIKDEDGNPIRGDDHLIAFSSSDPGNSFSPVIGHGDGTFTAGMTSSTKAGEVTITATDTATDLPGSGSATLVQTAGDPASLRLSVDPRAIEANGLSTATVTAIAHDAHQNGVAGLDLEFSSSDPENTFADVTDNGDGSYSTVLTSSAKGGKVTITASEESVSPAMSDAVVLVQRAFKVRKPRPRPNGTGALPVNVPGKGSVAVRQAGGLVTLLKPVRRDFDGSKQAKLILKPSRRGIKRYAQGKPIRVKIRATYDPAIGADVVVVKRLVLRRR